MLGSEKELFFGGFVNYYSSRANCMPNVNSDKISITIAIFSMDLTEKWWLSDIVEA